MSTLAPLPVEPDEDHDDDEHHTGAAVVRRDPDLARTDAENSLADLLDEMGWAHRDGQFTMTGAVARAMADRTHLLVEAPTGTGKSLAYLIPAAQQARATHKPVIVVTATKALQQQIIDSDAPLLSKVFPGLDVKLLKGRGNFACPAKTEPLFNGTEESLFDERIDEAVWNDLLEWVNTTDTGDRADSPDGVTDKMWSKVSVGPRECVGASKCQFAAQCFAERAGAAAKNADIVVTNSTLYLIDAQIGAGGVLVPDHSHVVVDEGHKLVETASRVGGVEIRHGRGKAIMGACRNFVKDEDLAEIVEADDRLLTHLLNMTETGAVDPSVGRLCGPRSGSRRARR